MVPWKQTSCRNQTFYPNLQPCGERTVCNKWQGLSTSKTPTMGLYDMTLKILLHMRFWKLLWKILITHSSFSCTHNHLNLVSDLQTAKMGEQFPIFNSGRVMSLGQPTRLHATTLNRKYSWNCNKLCCSEGQSCVLWGLNNLGKR